MHPSRGFGVILLWSLLSSCGLTAGQQTAVRTFATAATNFGTLSAQDLIALRDGTATVRTARYGIAEANIPAELKNAGGVPDIYHGFTEADLQMISTGPATIKAYGDALTAIMTADTTLSITTTTGNLNSAFAKFPNGWIGASYTNIITGVGQAIAELSVEQMRANAVKRIVPRAHDAVNYICSSISDLLDPTAPAAGPLNRASEFASEARTLQEETQAELYDSSRIADMETAPMRKHIAEYLAGHPASDL
jgi:hypothetical protein